MTFLTGSVKNLSFAQFSTNASRGGPSTYDLAKRKVDKLIKQAPAVKAELEKQIPRFKLLNSALQPGESRQSFIPPDKVLKSLDSNFESFFYKREYTERNFCFYMQACA